jgi:hypothetical protein
MRSPLRLAPHLGDAYLVPAGATGAWSSHVDSIAVWTARGWSYIAPKIGYLLYVENQLGYYHYAPSGSWVAGIGTSALGSSTVLPASLLGGKSAWQVENQTTNAPPGSPADGVQYIIGPSPTGAWAGNAGKLTIAKNNAWIIVTPLEGWTAYDKNLNTGYVYNGGWIAQVAGYDQITSADDLTSATLTPGGSTAAGYVFSTTAPTSTQDRRCVETLTASLAAAFAGQTFDLEYFASVTAASITTSGTGNAIDSYTVALFVDSEVTARDWIQVAKQTSSVTTNVIPSPLFAPLRLTLADTSAHTIRIHILPHGTGSISGGTITIARRRIIARRRAS